MKLTINEKEYSYKKKDLINIELYNTKLLVVQEDRTGGSCTTWDDFNFIVIRLPLEPSPGLIAHEIYHAVEFISDEIGYKLTDEAGAYLTGFITDKVYEKLEKEDERR